MAPLSLPPGFGFHPTDEELVAYYLKRKIHGHKIELDIIPEVDLYKCEPWDLPEKSSMHGKESSWHFFSARDRKYPNGARTNRATEAGYWKATGKDRKVTSQKRLIGTKKTLVFHQGRAPLGKRTDWIMHEYRIDESECNGSKDLKDTFVLCRVFKKNGWQTKAEEVGKQIKNDIQSSKKHISIDEASEKSSDPQTRSPEDIKPLLLPKTHETLQDLPEEVFTVEEWLNMLEDGSEPDNNLVPSEWNSYAMEAESALKPSPPSEDQDLPWYSEDYTFSNSTGATPEQSNDAEILEELLQVIQASETYSDNQSHIQNEEAYGTLDYKNVKGTNDASENWGDFRFDEGDAGIQIRPRKQFVDPSEGATMSRIRMKSNLADIGSSVDKRENHVFYEKRREDEAYLAELQEQIFLFDSFEMQNNGPKVSSNCYFAATPTGSVIERNTDGKLLPGQNQSVTCNSGILNVNKNDDAASGSLHNHVVSAMYADTCLMSGGSTEVVESREQPLVLNESELVTYKGDCKDHQEKQKENNIVGNAKGCSVTDGSENNHEDITSQLTLKSRLRRRSSRARPVEGSGDSQEQCHKTIKSTSHHINEVTLSKSTTSSPTTLILYLCLVGTTFLFFFLFRCILRAVRTVMSFSL